MKSRGLFIASILFVGLGLFVTTLRLSSANAEAPGSWSSTTPYHSTSASVNENPNCGIYSGKIICVERTNGVWWNTYSAGTIGPTWTSAESVPTVDCNQANLGCACAFGGGYVYCIDNRGGSNHAQYASFASLVSGSGSAWISTTTAATDVTAAWGWNSCGITQGYMVCIGGVSGNLVGVYATATSSGLGPSTTQRFTGQTSTSDCGVSPSSGVVYCVGGTSSSPNINVVTYSVFTTSFSIPTTTTVYPIHVGETTCTILDNIGLESFIYCVGGVNNAGSAPVNSLYYAQVTSGGIVGGWQTGTMYPHVIAAQGCLSDNQYLLCIGGQGLAFADTADSNSNQISLPATVTLTCPMSNGAPSTTVTLSASSGPTPSPNNPACDGLPHMISVSPSVTLTATEPAASSTARYTFHPTGSITTTLSITTPGSGGSSSWTFHNYYNLNSTFQMVAGSPSTFDTTVTLHASGVLGGNGSTVICDEHIINGHSSASCFGWYDWDTLSQLPASFNTLAGGTWSSTDPNSWTDFSGGNLHTTHYSLSTAFFLRYQTVGGGSPPAAPTVLCTVNGTPTNTTLTTSSIVYGCDPGTSWSVGHNPLGTGGPVGTERWWTTQSLSGIVPTGTTSITFTFFQQERNTYQLSPTSPTTWDQAYSEDAKGYFWGVSGSVICTATPASGGGTAGCTNWADDDLPVCLPLQFASLTSGYDWTSNTGVTPCFTDTTGGNTNTAGYTLESTAGQMILRYTIQIAAPGSPTAPHLSCTQFGGPYTASLTFTATIYYCDPGTAWTVSPNPLTGSSSNFRWETNMPLSGVSANQNINFLFYPQTYNQYGMNPSGPSTWDATYHQNVTATQFALPVITCTITLANGGGLADCSGWSDYNTAASLPVSFPSAPHPSQSWATTNTVTWFDTTGGNTHSANYTIALVFQIKLTEVEGGPAKNFFVAGCSVSPGFTTGDGTAHSFSSTSSCGGITVSANDNATDRVRFTSSGTNSVTFVPVYGQLFAFTYHYQVNVTIIDDNTAVSSVTPSGTYWANYGVPFPVSVTIQYNVASLPKGIFKSWTPTGGVTLSSTTTNPTMATATSHGVLTADVWTIVYNIVAPNPLTITFWIFPTIITVAVMFYFLITAVRRGATTWARNYMFLTGLNTGILMALITETMPFPMLILGLIAWFLYAYRG